MSLESLRERKRDLEQIKEYQCGDHPTRILYVSNITPKELPNLTSLLNSQPQTVKLLFTDELEKFGFVLISFYDLREAIAIHRLLHKTQKYTVYYALAKDVLNNVEQNQGTVVVFNIDSSVTNDEIKSVFGQCGDIKELRETPKKTHHRFVEYFDLRDAQRAINELNQFELKGRKLKIEPSRPCGIRQRVLLACVNALGMSEAICGLPPPQEMMKMVCKRMKEIEYGHYPKRQTGMQRYYHENPSSSYSSPSTSSQSSSFSSSSSITPSIQPLKLTTPSPLVVSTSSSTSLDCLSSLPSVSTEPYRSQSETEFDEIETIKPLQFATSSTSLFCSLSSNSSNSTSPFAIHLNQTSPTKQSLQSLQSIQTIQTPHKEENVTINVPRPTTVGQELSKQYSKEIIGTPHLHEKKFNYFTAIESKGLGFDKKEDVDEMKRVLVIENIPITFTYNDLLKRIEKCISCFYDQFFLIKSDAFKYRCIIRVTNQMVVENFMLSFNNIFLEDDQEELCVVREIHCQGNYFSEQLNTLLV